MKRSLFFLFFMGWGVSSLSGIISIPIHFFSFSDLPIIQVEMEGNKHMLELDTGAVGEINLKEEILKAFEKCGTTKLFDINGNIYPSFKYLIPNLKIGNLEFKNLVAINENVDLLVDGCVIFGTPNVEMGRESFEQVSGSIGWGVLQKLNWYFDFYNSLLWVVENLEELRNELSYFSLGDYVEVPFEINKSGIVLSIETSVGMKKVLLDTGANLFCLRKSLVEQKYMKEVKPGRWVYWSKMIIGGVHFGHYPFYLYDFTPMLDVDGILGIQFFKKNGIYLDFQNKRALIGPARQPFWRRIKEQYCGFCRWLKYLVF